MTEKEIRKDKLNQVKEEFDKYRGECSLLAINNNETKKLERFELSLMEGEKYLFRGFNIFKYTEDGQTKVHNADLFETIKNTIIANSFIQKEDEETKKPVEFLNAPYIYQHNELGIKYEIKKLTKKIQFIFNNEKLFTLRLVKVDNQYVITAPAYNKARNFVNDKLTSIFMTNAKDFAKYEKLISLVMEYLFMS